ncbi:YfiR family protein [Geomonas anaerohicana]|uniref:YfiR family protein n=1 Tax=Geomonas anaerohicana TaxID=2798583 RepID=A0ABS0Y9V9_9BACT|nr:YfiR family protein [Geomonas anaerohicana]MBJ6748744.1 YfiR family protein [Geomonas anaerohicana]
MPVLSRIRRCCLGFLLPALLCLLLAHPGPLGADAPQEYQVKSAMVYNMAKYIEWPADAFSGTGAPLVVCCLGRGPFTAALEQYRGKTVLGHPLQVRRVQPGEELGICHLLVVSGVEKRYLAGILDQARRRSLLTVSDQPDFARLGGIIGLVEIEGRVRFEINVKAAQQSRFKISSQLLKLARIVREGD